MASDSRLGCRHRGSDLTPTRCSITTEAGPALERWRAELEAYAIPKRILDEAPESPWGFPAELFRARADRARATPARTPTIRRAREALPAGGRVLDVGCGGGATSLPLADRAAELVGVDEQADMLATFADQAARAGVRAASVRGRWPDVGSEAPDADVVVCGHVVYNVAALAPFARALQDHATRRVVVELTDRHPMAWTADLWLRFHDLRRPDGPTVDDAAAALADLGIECEREDRDGREDPSGGGFERREDAVALVRRRLCLPASRDPEIEESLGDRLFRRGDLWSAGPRERVVSTLWWDI